jgi:restriction endonuclease S subunit
MSEIKQDYKQTKVGIIPEDWDVVKLGDLSQNGIMNGVFNDPKKVGKGLKLINVVNLYNEPFINYDDLKLLEVSEKEYKKFSALKGDLFFTRSSLKEEGIAHCNLFNIDTNDTVFECHTMRIRPNKEIVNSYSLFRFFLPLYPNYQKNRRSYDTVNDRIRKSSHRIRRQKNQRGNQIVEQQSNGLIHTHRSIVS